MKSTKMVKASIFILIGVAMLFVKFYIITHTMDDGTLFYKAMVFWGTEEVWDEFFKPSIMNFVIGGLFILLGLIEFKEAFTDGS